MVFYSQEILEGLSEVYLKDGSIPGVLIVTGDSQAVMTGNRSDEILMAACKFGNGKILVASHDAYIYTFDKTTEQKKRDLARNLKRWFTGNENLSKNFITSIDKIADNIDIIENYKIIIWQHNFNLSQIIQTKLLSFIENGGSLFCCATIWGHLQVHPGITIQDISMFNFLKNYTGIILTSDYMDPGRLEVKNNQAKYSNFDLALEKVFENTEDNLEKYYETIQNGIDVLHNLNLIDDVRLNEIRNKLLESCISCGIRTTPCSKEPINTSLGKTTVNILGKCILSCEGEKAPGVKDFPGDFDQTPCLLNNVEISLQTEFEERLSTGYYLPAGVFIFIKVNSSEFENWSVRIGAHTDDLTNCDEYCRWPRISLTKKLSKEMCFSSPFGGLVYFESPNSGGNLHVTISNIVESPYFDLNIPETIDKWNEKRSAPGLWAEIAGKHIIFTSPSHCVRKLEDPGMIISFWDSVVKGHHKLRGTNPNDFRRERVVNDRQPSAGYMHSGYPIVTHLDCCEENSDECIYDLQKLYEKGNWGMFHELGHNMQREEWTFDGSTEVTVNIFSLHVFHDLLNREVNQVAWLLGTKPAMKNYFSNNNPTYLDWQSDFGVALATFAQLIKHFGWESMYKFMSQYENDIKVNKNIPKDNQEKIDQWVIRYSKIVGKNIKKQFKMFGLPVSQSVDDQVENLEIWFPENEKDPEIFFA